MLEAITSSAMNAVAARVDTEKVSALRSSAITASTAAPSATAPYYSPYIIVDSNFNKAILAIRDNETGNVTQQYPTESQIKAYKRAQQVQAEVAASIAEASQPQPDVSQARAQPVELPENLQPLADKVAAEAQAAIASRGNSAEVEDVPQGSSQAAQVDTSIASGRSVSTPQAQTRVLVDA